MTKEDIKLEESFLNIALEKKISLRLSLANRERISGRLSSLSKYDIVLDVDGTGLVVLPKKEVYNIMPSEQILDESFFPPIDDATSPTSRSRVQDDFLNRYIKEKTLALLTLTTGEELRGVIEGYDGFTISLKTGRGRLLLYKHGLCSLGPGYRRAGRDNAK